MAVGDDLQDSPDVGPGAPARELAVAERPCPPFAEEIIALRVDRPPLVEPADVGHAVLDLAPSLQDQRAGSRASASMIAGEQPGRPRADDDGAILQRGRARLGPVEVPRPRMAETSGARSALSRGAVAGDCRPRPRRRSGGRPGGGRRGSCARSGSRTIPSRHRRRAGRPASRGRIVLGLVEFEADVGDFPGHGSILQRMRNLFLVGRVFEAHRAFGMDGPRRLDPPHILPGCSVGLILSLDSAVGPKQTSVMSSAWLDGRGRTRGCPGGSTCRRPRRPRGTR